jgi:hypothetical protein
MVHFPKWYAFGKVQEARVLPVIREKFQRDIKQNETQYAKYDFYDEDYNYELKSRTFHYRKYDTTMIQLNKTCGCTNDDRALMLLFNFTDGLYYIEYDKEKFDKYFRQQYSQVNESWDERPHLYIPIADLHLLHLWDDKKPDGYKSSQSSTAR